MLEKFQKTRFDLWDPVAKDFSEILMNEVMMRGQNRMEESFAKSWLCYKSVRKYGRLARMHAGHTIQKCKRR